MSPKYLRQLLWIDAIYSGLLATKSQWSLKYHNLARLVSDIVLLSYMLTLAAA